jgi:putative ABC transport system permease protein
MIASLQLAWRYLTRHTWQSTLLTSALGMVVALPLAVRLLVETAETSMQARAASTPVLLGSQGSAADLLLGGLYFNQLNLPTVEYRNIDTLASTHLGTPIPVHLQFQAQDAPIVGTTLDYLEFRGLSVESGRSLTRLGDCVLGARVAADRNLSPGDAIFSTPDQLFDMAGTYPLKMRVRGVLRETGTADDEAVFVDIKTAWVIEGYAHGHEDLREAEAVAVLKEDDDGNIVGSAAVRMYQEITDENVASFHLHGDTGALPIHAILFLPDSDKSATLLAGRYVHGKSPLQFIRPIDEFERLLKTLFKFESLALGILAFTGAAALAITALVFALSFRMRKREFATLEDIGISHRALILAKVLEIVLIGLGGVLVASVILLVVERYAGSLVLLTLS